MGTSFARTTRAALIEELRRPPAGYTLLASTLKGSHLWLLLQPPAPRPPMIGLYLLSAHRGEQGYKGLAEADGPVACDCPVSYLDQAPVPDSPYAEAWRERVRAHHAAASARRASPPGPGQRRTFNGVTYTLMRCIGPRKGWEVTDDQGTRYRLPATYLTRSTIAC
jgi:hypothetical protein